MTVLFFTGDSGVGKSTLILREVQKWMKEREITIGGYVTHRCFAGDKVAGYGIRDAEEYLSNKENIFPPVVQFDHFPTIEEQRENKMFQVHLQGVQFEMEDFKKYIYPYMEKDRELIILDELGGTDFIDGEFFEKVRGLCQKKKVIGVYRVIDDYSFFAKARKLTEKQLKDIQERRKLFEEELGENIVRIENREFYDIRKHFIEK